MNGTYGIIAPDQPKLISADPATGSARRLRVDNVSGSENTRIGIAADSIVLADARYNTIAARSVSVVVDSAVVGPGGVESGTTISGNNWYARHVIACRGTGRVEGLFSASATAPILPAGFDFWAFTGWHRTVSGNFHRIQQRGAKATYVVSAAVTTALPTCGTGSAGTYSETAPTYTTVSVSNVVPTTASLIHLIGLSNWNNGTLAALQVAPNTNYGGHANTNGKAPPFDNKNGGIAGAVPFSMVLEGTTIAYAGNAAGAAVLCRGWDEEF